MPRSPLLFEGTTRQPPSPARALGADTDAVLGEVLGYDAARIAELRELGALG
jgi:crotonobetainyl-CoA:carnitine CoA-transferase CaiB-like acyl-CoA transferase